MECVMTPQPTTALSAEEQGKALYMLIDRLQALSEIKYPNRKWSRSFYHECAFQWADKVNELQERVISLEKELNDKPQTP